MILHQLCCITSESKCHLCVIQWNNKVTLLAPGLLLRHVFRVWDIKSAIDCSQLNLLHSLPNIPHYQSAQIHSVCFVSVCCVYIGVFWACLSRHVFMCVCVCVRVVLPVRYQFPPRPCWQTCAVTTVGDEKGLCTYTSCHHHCVNVKTILLPHTPQHTLPSFSPPSSHWYRKGVALYRLGTMTSDGALVKQVRQLFIYGCMLRIWSNIETIRLRFSVIPHSYFSWDVITSICCWFIVRIQKYSVDRKVARPLHVL